MYVQAAGKAKLTGVNMAKQKERPALPSLALVRDGDGCRSMKTR